MSKIRLRFSKTDKVRYISHLDLMRTLKRAFLRAGISLKYTQGFNPHPYMSIALPLPVGCESECELLDIELLGDGIPDGLTDSLNAVLPGGIRMTDAYLPARKFSDIARVKLSGRLIFDGGAGEQKREELMKCLQSDSIVISKKTKSGVSDLDIAPHISDLSVRIAGGHELVITVSVSAQNPSVTPDNIVSALKNSGIVPDYTEFRRLELYDAKGDLYK